MSNLETSPVERSLSEKVNKRRSSVFKRQSIVPNEQDLENTNVTEEITQESKKFKLQEENQSESFNIKKYIENLKEEDEKWRDLYKKRKLRVQDLVKRDKNKELFGQPLDLSCLSDSERAFLKAKPDYEDFNKCVFQLNAMATKVTFLNLCSQNFSEKSTSKLKSDTDNVMDRIINMSD